MRVEIRGRLSEIGSLLCGPGIELRWQGSAADAFTHYDILLTKKLPSCCITCHALNPHGTVQGLVLGSPTSSLFSVLFL